MEASSVESEGSTLDLNARDFEASGKSKSTPIAEPCSPNTSRALSEAEKLYMEIFYDSGLVTGEWRAVGVEIMPLIAAALRRAADSATSNSLEIAAAMMCHLSDFDYLVDSEAAQKAWELWQKTVDEVDSGAWKDGKHSGDCTKEAHACLRCLVEKYREIAAAIAHARQGEEKKDG